MKKSIMDVFVADKATDEIVWVGRKVVEGRGEGYGDFDAPALVAFGLMSAGVTAEEVDNYAVGWNILLSYKVKE